MIKILKKAELKRFWAKVDKSGDCWLWTAGTARGYGQFRTESTPDNLGKVVKAHRFSWEIHFGEIPEGLHALHHCDTPACVNPEHLFLGTDQDNVDDRNNKNRQAKGSTHGSAKLDEEIANCVRKYYPMFTMKQLGVMFNVGERTISYVVNYRTWTHVE